MSRLYRQHVAANHRRSEIIARLQKKYSQRDYEMARHFANAYGLTWEDACHVEKLERKIDLLQEQETWIGLSDTDRQRIVELELEQDRFIRAAQRHAKRQNGRKVQRTDRQPVRA